MLIKNIVLNKNANIKPLRALGYHSRSDLAFHRELQAAAQRYLQQHNDHRFADLRFYVKSGILILLCLGSYAISLCGNLFSLNNISLNFYIFYPIFICFALLLAINIVHDASHNAIFKQVIANRWINFWITIPLGLDPDCWRVRHIIFHHAHTNIRYYDLDIEEKLSIAPNPLSALVSLYALATYLLAFYRSHDISSINLGIRLARSIQIYSCCR